MSTARKTGNVRSLFENRISDNHEQKSVAGELWTIQEAMAEWKCSRKTAERLIAINGVERHKAKGSALIRYRKKDILAVFKPS